MASPELTTTPEQPTATGPPRLTPTPTSRALTLWTTEEGPGLEVVRTLARDFAAQQGTPLVVVPKPADGLRLSLATAALVDEPPPDLFWADQEALAGLLADGRLQPVADEIRPPDSLPALTTAATAEGAVWGVPIAADGALLLFFNQAMTDTPPASSDELIARARAMTTPETAGLVMAWDEARWLLPWLHAFGGAPTSPDGQTITLETPAMTATLNLLRELYVAAPTENSAYSRGQRLFAQGYAAFAVDGVWALARYKVLSDTLNVGIAPLPVVPATGRAAAPPLGGTYLLFGRDLSGDALAQAQAFATFLSTPATQVRVAQALGRLPATRAALSDPRVTSDPLLGAAAALAPEGVGLPPTIAARCALYGIDVWLPNVLRGTLSQAEAPAAMQREAEACLARFP